MPSGLNSTSTYAQIKQVWGDNSTYYENQSTAQALEFVTACQMLLIFIPKHVRSAAGSEIDIDPATLAKQLDDAKQFLRANGIYAGSTAPRDITTSFEFLR